MAMKVKLTNDNHMTPNVLLVCILIIISGSELFSFSAASSATSTFVQLLLERPNVRWRYNFETSSQGEVSKIKLLSSH